MDSLISFSRDRENYRDSGEGGLFVMLLIPEPDDWSNNCHVDVSVTASRPDVLVHQTDNLPLWTPWDSRDNSFRCEAEIREVLEGIGRKQLASQFQRLTATSRAADEMSVSMLATVLLGSIGQSLYSEKDGNHWHAGYEDLTILGQMLYNTLKGAFGVEPVLATFLDT